MRAFFSCGFFFDSHPRIDEIYNNWSKIGLTTKIYKYASLTYIASGYFMYILRDIPIFRPIYGLTVGHASKRSAAGKKCSQIKTSRHQIWHASYTADFSCHTANLADKLAVAFCISTLMA